MKKLEEWKDDSLLSVILTKIYKDEKKDIFLIEDIKALTDQRIIILKDWIGLIDEQKIKYVDGLKNTLDNVVKTIKLRKGNFLS
jgi:hypothetical protein